MLGVMCQAKKEFKIYKVTQKIILGTCFSRLRGLKDVFIGFKFAIINTYTHTWPLWHLNIAIFEIKAICNWRACATEGMKGGLRGVQVSQGSKFSLIWSHYSCQNFYIGFTWLYHKNKHIFILKAPWLQKVLFIIMINKGVYKGCKENEAAEIINFFLCIFFILKKSAFSSI